MFAAGIEAINAFGGSACLDVYQLARHRGLDMSRFENLLMKQKAVAYPFEDVVTFAANAARPLLQQMSQAEIERIELLIVCTESGLDFSKSAATYVHQHLGLGRNCRLFEIKQACYAGTAGLQMALGFVLSRMSPGAKALVIASDISRFILPEGDQADVQDWAYAEPSGGAGAVALLVSEQAHIFQIDQGANGYYGHEVMDTCRPGPDTESGDPDLSLLSYLHCHEQAFAEYKKRVLDADYVQSFDYLAFHTPFGGMVKGAHRSQVRKQARLNPAQIQADFERRVEPGLQYCQRVGNIMGATVFLSLLSSIEHGDFSQARRIGCFSYGSGCCSEFYSGVVGPQAQSRLAALQIKAHLDQRHALSIDEYTELLDSSNLVRFGTRDVELDLSRAHSLQRSAGAPRLVLRAIRAFHREYEWIA